MNKMQDPLKIVVTGEVDSGKSTLIGRFLFEIGSLSQGAISEIENTCKGLGREPELAYLLDSLEEERKGERTLDTTQIFCKSKKGNGFLFIDVPGHRELFRNMLCGSAYADIAILVVDIKKAIEEGTKRHISVLSFLQVNEIIVVLNKMDTVDFDKGVFLDIKIKISEYFNSIGMGLQFIIPVCAQQGDNLIKRSGRMPWYEDSSLSAAIDRIRKRFKEKEAGEFYFPIQDTYNLDGDKVFVGTLLSGKLKKGETVKALPLNKEFKIKGIRAFDKFKAQARKFESIGLIIDNDAGLGRGQVLFKKDAPQVSTEIKAKVFCVHPLNKNDTVLFRCLTQSVPASISQVNKIVNTADLSYRDTKDNLLPLDVAEVVISTQKPVVVKRFYQFNALGRFVLQNNLGICAAGIVI